MGAVTSLVIGIIRGAHGLTGKVKVESTSGEVEHFFELTEVTLRKDGAEKKTEVESVEGGHPFLFMKCAGIDTPEQAAKLAGAEIVVPRDKACPLYEGEYYVEDLKNCALIYEPGSESNAKNGLNEDEKPEQIVAGIVTDVLEGGAGDLLEVSVSESLNVSSDADDGSSAKKKRTVLVPFKKEFIGDVDISKKTMQLMHLWILE